MTTYAYDGVGNRESIDHANGTRSTYSYDDLNRLIQMTSEGPAPSRDLIAQHSYTLGDAGNRLALDETLTQPDGSTVTRSTAYTYDALYRLRREVVTDSTGVNRQTDWDYDRVGNRDSETRTGGTNPGTTTYLYDVNDWLQSETSGASVTSYTYDDNGNTLTRSVDGIPNATYTYDSDNRMTQANVTAGGITTATFYEYDVNGVRQQETTGGITRQYLVDANRAYAQVIEESDTLSGLMRLYTYGDDLISQSRITGGNPSNATTDVYLYDGLGSVRSLTSDTGSVTDTYLYQAFGDLEAQAGTTPNNYRYTGEQYDPNVGFYYLRARYYNPSIGRFQTMDTYAGRMHEPATLHKYLYVHADPVNNTDPSGNVTLGQLMSGIANGARTALSSVTGLASVAKRTAAQLVVNTQLGALRIASRIRAAGTQVPRASKAIAKAIKEFRKFTRSRGFRRAQGNHQIDVWGPSGLKTPKANRPGPYRRLTRRLRFRFVRDSGPGRIMMIRYYIGRTPKGPDRGSFMFRLDYQDYTSYPSTFRPHYHMCWDVGDNCKAHNYLDEVF